MPEHQFEWVPTDAEVAEAFARLSIPAASKAAEFQGSFNRAFPYTDAEGRRRVLRLRPRWLTERRMRFEHALADRLAGRGLPVLSPVILGGRDTWMKIGDCYAEVYPFVTGREGQPLAEDAHLSGAVLARFHSEALGLDRGSYEPPDFQNQLGAPELLSLLGELVPSATCGGPLGSLLPDAQPALDQARSHLRELHARGGTSLPATIRHGDPHIWNFLYSEEGPARVLALLDLDMAAEGPRIFDVSYALYFLIGSTALADSDPPNPDRTWRPLCQQFMRGYAGATDTAVGTAEATAACPQMHCLAAHFLYWDIVRATKLDDISAACQHYRSIACMISEQEADVLAVVAGA